MFPKALTLHRWHLDQQAERHRLMEHVNAQVTIAPNDSLLEDVYSMRTLRLIESINEPGMSDALYQWIKVPETELRELIAFGFPYSETVGRTILRFAVSQTKKSHPRFACPDLSEMDEEDSSAFTRAFGVLINVYINRRPESLMRAEDKSWHGYASMRFRGMAHDAFPRPTSELVELIMKYDDREEAITKYIIERGLRINSPDIEGLVEHLESSSPTLAGGFL